MNIQRIHDQIILKAQTRVIAEDIYYERHHIIPRCMGGGSNSENLVSLTGREHFLIHWLLAELNPSNKKLTYAFWVMCWVNNGLQPRYTPSSRVYEYSKELHASNLRGREVAKSTRKKLSYAMTGIKRSEFTKNKIGEANRGKKLSDEHKLKISKSMIGKNKGIKRSAEVRARLSESAKKRPYRTLTEEHKRKIGLANSRSK